MIDKIFGFRGYRTATLANGEVVLIEYNDGIDHCCECPIEEVGGDRSWSREGEESPGFEGPEDIVSI